MSQNNQQSANENANEVEGVVVDTSTTATTDEAVEAVLASIETQSASAITLGDDLGAELDAILGGLSEPAPAEPAVEAVEEAPQLPLTTSDELEDILNSIAGDAPVIAEEAIIEGVVEAVVTEEAPAEPATEEDVPGGVIVETVPEVEVTLEDLDDSALNSVLDEVEALVEAAPEPKATKPAKTPKAPKSPSAPKAPKAPKAPPVVLREFVSVAAISKDDLDANIAATNAVKVREKIDNFIQHIESGKALSTYTRKAVDTLIDKGSVSAKDLVEVYLASGLKDGTARAQAQQMTALFKVVGLVTPAPSNSRELVLADQALLDELRPVAATV